MDTVFIWLLLSLFWSPNLMYEIHYTYICSLITLFLWLYNYNSLLLIFCLLIASFTSITILYCFKLHLCKKIVLRLFTNSSRPKKHILMVFTDILMLCVIFVFLREQTTITFFLYKINIDTQFVSFQYLSICYVYILRIKWGKATE